MEEQRIFREDIVKIDYRNYVEDTDPVFGPITIFKDVVIASEIIHPYEDGNAYKPADELEKGYWTWSDRWAISGDHPKTGIISKRGDVHGRTVNVRFVKNLKDHKTGRPNRRGILVDLQVFNKKVSPEILQAMKSGEKSDVSIGFFFTMDASPGTIEEDGHPLHGQSYDYIQRDFMGEHTAFGLDKGRCPMPYCGIGADELLNQFVLSLFAGDPFGKWKTMAACIKEIMKENPKYTKEQAAATCATIEKKSKAKKDVFRIALENLRDEANTALTQLDEIEELKRDEGETIVDEIMSGEDLSGLFEFYKEHANWDALPEEARTSLTTIYNESKEIPDDAKSVEDAPLEEVEITDDCPECDAKAEQLATDLSLEDIDKKLKELKEAKDGLREQIRKLDEKLYDEPDSEKKRKAAIRKQRDELWDKIDSLYDEIRAYTQAKTIKITQSALVDEGTQDDDELKDVAENPSPKIEIDVEELLGRSRRAIKKMTHPF